MLPLKTKILMEKIIRRSITDIPVVSPCLHYFPRLPISLSIEIANCCSSCSSIYLTRGWFRDPDKWAPWFHFLFSLIIGWCYLKIFVQIFDHPATHSLFQNPRIPSSYLGFFSTADLTYFAHFIETLSRILVLLSNYGNVKKIANLLGTAVFLLHTKVSSVPVTKIPAQTLGFVFINYKKGRPAFFLQ